MILEELQKDKIKSMKYGNHFRKQVLTDMIDAIQKAAITPKGRIEITDELADEVLIKYQKTVQEMIDTCPESRVLTMAEYMGQMEIVKEYAPQLITDEDFIRTSIKVNLETAGIEINKKNRGQIMKLIMPMYKGKADMKVVNKVIGDMLK